MPIKCSSPPKGGAFERRTRFLFLKLARAFRVTQLQLLLRVLPQVDVRHPGGRIPWRLRSRAFFFCKFCALCLSLSNQDIFQTPAGRGVRGMSSPTSHARADALRNPSPPVGCVVGYVVVYSLLAGCSPRPILKWTKVDIP